MYVMLGEYWIAHDKIVAIKAAAQNDGKSHTIVFCVGHPTTDGGFLIPEPIDDVMERLQMANAMSEVGNQSFAEAEEEERRIISELPRIHHPESD